MQFSYMKLNKINSKFYSQLVVFNFNGEIFIVHRILLSAVKFA